MIEGKKWKSGKTMKKKRQNMTEICKTTKKNMLKKRYQKCNKTITRRRDKNAKIKSVKMKQIAAKKKKEMQ